MLQDRALQFCSHRMACKQWSVLIAVALLAIGVLGRLNTAAMLCAAAPMLLLAFVDAGYAMREKLESESGEAGNENVLIKIRRFIHSLGSLSVWAFYLALWGIFAVSACHLPRFAVPVQGALTTAAATPQQTPSNVTGYPPGMPLRYPNGAPYSGNPPRTTAPGFPRAATPMSFTPRPLIRPPNTPFGDGGPAPQVATPVR